MVPQVELFQSFFGRIEDTQKTFRNWLTFSSRSEFPSNWVFNRPEKTQKGLFEVAADAFWNFIKSKKLMLSEKATKFGKISHIFFTLAPSSLLLKFWEIFRVSSKNSNLDIFTCVEFELTCAGLSEIEGGGAIVHRLCIADIEVKPIP